MRHILQFLVFLIHAKLFCQINGLSRPKIGQGSKPCYSSIRVKDERPNNCSFNGNDLFYPVLIENCSYKEDFPNNWTFEIPNNPNKTDAYSTSDYANAVADLSHAYTNNFYAQNGEIIMEYKKEVPPITNTVTGQSFNYSGSILKSIFKVKQGIFQIRVKTPNNFFFWPSFWLRESQEIDAFEYWYDSGSNICDNYNMMRTTTHGYINNNQQDESYHCQRTRKKDMGADFHKSYHTYTLFWTDYKIQVDCDNLPVFSATKYFDGSANVIEYCDLNTIPVNSYNCSYMSNAQGCDFGLNLPNFPDVWNSYFQCFVYNTVNKDLTFAKTSDPMSVLISMIIRHSHNNDINSQWYNFGQIDREYIVDNISLLQPVDCNNNKTIFNVNDIKSYTGGTNFLSGNKIEIGNQSNSTSFQSTMQQVYNGQEFPIHLLASDQIIFNSEVIIEEGLFLRAEIIDCNNTSTFNEKINQRKNNERNPENYTENQYKDTTTNFIKPSVNDNGAVVIYPNPTYNFSHIIIPEEDFYQLNKIILTDYTGKIINENVSDKVNLDSLNPGIYTLIFYFKDGNIVSKKVIKQ
ncbi:MAG: family 16 glycosylhydrolase [Bacteroidetes bacterium]|nr:family 16 glycosylhydrolase [Bacteroidota bacterium]